ncbi:MAG: alanine racemase [Phycisphaeraceae bacterium]
MSATTGYLRAEISAAAIRWNLGLLREGLAPRTHLCAVVKADCYGHGLATLLPVLARSADCLAVATPTEALALRHLGYHGLVLVFSACAYGDGAQIVATLDDLIEQQITLSVASAAEIVNIAASGLRVGKRASVHIKLDSGMGRSGLLPASVGVVVKQLRQHPVVDFTGIYTHLATADEADKSFALEQFRRFMQAAGNIAGVGNSPPQELVGQCPILLHAANSAATIDLPQTHLNMVRPGIALYGYQPSEQMHRRLPLRPALRLLGPLIQVKALTAGSKCGYGLTHAFEVDSRVGLVPIGYADGYLRSLSNRACMRVRGREAPIRGRISMDQTIIDLTDVPEARVGDEVEIISPDPAAPNSVENLARLAGTIPYEITCRLGGRIDRVLVDAELE